MKKTSKSILSLLFALIFVFQFVSVAGTAAFADEDEEVEPASVAVKVDGEDYSEPVSLEALKNGLEFIPSEGAYVKSVSINGVGVTGYCIADGRVLSIDGDAVEDMLDDETISEEDAPFSVSAVAEELPEEALESITAPAASEAELEEGREFICWKYRYENRAIVLVEAGETFVPFIGCELVGPISREVVVEEEELELESAELEKTPLLLGPLSPPKSAEYSITVKPTGGSKTYDGQNAPALDNSAFTIVSAKKGDAILTAEGREKLDVSGVVLSYKESSTAWVGDHPILANVENAKASFNGSDIEASFAAEEGTFTVNKIALTIKAKAVSKVYDGKVLSGDYEAAALLGGHKVSGLKYITETSAICDTTYKVDPTSEISIKNSGGSDVSGVYDVTFSDEAAAYVITAPETKTKLSAKAVDVTKDYTGSPVEGSISLTGELPKDATVVASYDYQDTRTDIGSHQYALKSIAIMLDGHDISAAFDIDIDDSVATLKITGHSYTITVKNATKEYDGTALKPTDYYVNGLMEGDRIYAITLTGEQTDAGTSKSDVKIDSIVIHNASDEDVTKAYGKPTVNQGNLTVNKLAFTLTAKDATKVYDGTALTRNEYSISGTDKAKLDKLGSWSLNVAISGSIKEVGTAVNKIGTVELKVGSNVVDPKNYEVTRVDGTLTVEADSTKPTVTITVESKKKVYDGTALILEPDAYTVSDTLPSGWSIDVTLETASITAAGSKQVTVKEYKVYQTKDNVKTLIDDPAKFPFNIALKPGTLTVTKYPITITAKSGTKTYDGKEFVLNSVTITAANNKIVDGQKIEINVEAQDADGNTVKAVKVGKYYNVVTQVVIKEGNKDVTSNYDITTVNGTLTIKNSNGNPQTGDTSNISLWATILAVSAVAVVCIVVVVLVRNKKKAD